MSKRKSPNLQKKEAWKNDENEYVSKLEALKENNKSSIQDTEI